MIYPHPFTDGSDDGRFGIFVTGAGTVTPTGGPATQPFPVGRIWVRQRIAVLADTVAVRVKAVFPGWQGSEMSPWLLIQAAASWGEDYPPELIDSVTGARALFKIDLRNPETGAWERPSERWGNVRSVIAFAPPDLPRAFAQAYARTVEATFKLTVPPHTDREDWIVQLTGMAVVVASDQEHSSASAYVAGYLDRIVVELEPPIWHRINWNAIKAALTSSGPMAPRPGG